MLIETPVSNTRFLVYLQVFLKKMSRYGKYSDIKDSEFKRISEFRPLPKVDVSSLETEVVDEPERFEWGEIGSLEFERSDFEDFMSGFVSASDWSDAVEFNQDSRFAPVDANPSSQAITGSVSSSIGSSLSVSPLGSEAGSRLSEGGGWSDIDVGVTPNGYLDVDSDITSGDGEVEEDDWNDDDWDVVEEVDEPTEVDEEVVDDWDDGDWGSDSFEVEEDSPVEISEDYEIDESDGNWSSELVSEEGDDTHFISSTFDNETLCEPTVEDLFTYIYSSSYKPSRRPLVRVVKKFKDKPKQKETTPRVSFKPVSLGSSPVTPPPPPPVSSGSSNDLSDRFARRESEDLVAYTRRLVRVSESIALQNFSPKEIEQALSTGKVLRRRGVIIFSHN